MYGKYFIDTFKSYFNGLASRTYVTAQKHGFQEYQKDKLFVPTKLALISSEVSEALEAHRTKDDDHIGEELADIVIRTMDLAVALKIDLGKKIIDKAIANEKRPFKHGGKRY